MRPVFHGVGCLLAAVACGAAPVPPSAASAEPREVPLRDTSDDLSASPSVSLSSTPERFRPRTLEDAPVLTRHGRLIDLDVKGADIRDVCRLLADVGHANIVVADDVQGAVTVRMKAVPWDEALRVIAEAKGLHTVHEADFILVKAAGK